MNAFINWINLIYPAIRRLVGSSILFFFTFPPPLFWFLSGRLPRTHSLDEVLAAHLDISRAAEPLCYD